MMDETLEPGGPISIGTLPLLRVLENEVAGTTVAINLQTIVRNRLAEMDTDKDVLTAKDIKEECSIITMDIITLFLRYKTAVTPYILIYYFDYEAIYGADNIRPDSKSRQVLNDTCRRALSELKTTSIMVNGVKCEFFTAKTGPAHHVLFNKIYTEQSKPTLVLFSHQPVDWHVRNYIDSLYIVQSHTGAVLNPFQLSKKVFTAKYQHIPFYTSTHSLLGDKSLILPKLKPKVKAELEALAINEHWLTHSNAFVAERLDTLGVLNDILC